MTELSDQERIIDPADVSMRPTAVRYGVAVALAIIVIGLIFTLLDLSDPTDPSKIGNTIQQLISYVAILVAVVLAIQHHRNKELGGYISYGRGLAIGTFTGLIIGVISAIWTLIYMYVIDPEMQDKIKKAAIQKAIEQGAPQETFDQGSGLMDTFTSPIFLALAGLFGTVLVAFIISLIVAAVLKKESPKSF